MITKVHETSLCKLNILNKLLGETPSRRIFCICLKREKKKCDFETHNLQKQSMKCGLYIGFKLELARS